MGFPKKTSIAIAANKRSNFPLVSSHVTTDNFMKISVAKCMELVPKQQIDVMHECFSRLEPLPVPTFGKAKVRHKVFWVPYRTIFPAWDNLYNDTPHVYNNGASSIPEVVPFIREYVINDFLKDPTISTVVTDTTTVRPDFGSRRFTALGRFAYKILKQLGYSPRYSEVEDGYVGLNSITTLMPLLGLIKLYVDWFYPSQYTNDEDSLYLQSFLIRNDEVDYGEEFMTSGDLVRVFRLLYELSYDADYFTNAWDNPAGPNQGLFSSVNITDSTLFDNNSYITNDIDSTGTPVASVPVFAGGTISQFALNALRSLTDYMKRHQIVGARALDRYLSRWGVKLSSEKLKRSELITTYDQIIQFGDVTSTSDTDGAHLGAYAGKGMTFGEGKFNFDTNGEFGMLYIITTIVPDIDYYQGINRHVLHLSRLDFFTPEFDNLGTQPISQAEVYSPLYHLNQGDLPEAINWNGYQDKIFGFTPRYAEYKTDTSMISGDYALNSRNVGKDSWTLFRDVSNLFDERVVEIVHNPTFVSAVDRYQYDRIFYNTDNRYDKFNIIHNFKIQNSFPGSALFDTYEFKDEDKSSKVSMDVGGTHVV